MKGGFRSTKTPSVDAVRKQQQQQASKFKTTKPRQQTRDDKSGQPASGKCLRCGKGSHPRQKCQAKDAICHSCKKKGHYSSCCLSKSAHKSVRFSKEVNDVSEDEELCDSVYLDCINTNKDAKSWST